MKKLFLLLSVGLYSITSFAQQTNETINIGGTNRDFIQYLPVGYNSSTESLPVVFVLHGIGGTASQMTTAGVNLIADTARFIVVYPQGKANFQGQNSWQNGTLLESTADDIGFFNGMIDRYLNQYNANSARIYCTGLSMGSIMSYTLACALNDRIAAIGCMSGTMSTDDINNCTPSYKTPVIHIHGTADNVVPYDQNALPSLSLVPETMNFWINQHNCYTTADSTQFPDIANDGLTVDRFVYQNCTPNASLELLRVNNGTHTYFFQPVNDFTEAIEIWRFFSQWQHSNPAPAGLSQYTLENNTVVYPNPSNGNFVISSPVNQETQLFNLSGNLVETIDLKLGENVIHIDHLAKGIYTLKLADGSAQRISIQ